MSQNNDVIFSGCFFDWYQVTIEEDDVDLLVSRALEHWGFSSVERVKPRLGTYIRACEVRRGDRCIFHACWGGVNPGVHLIASGSIAHDVSEWLGSVYGGRYTVTRADVRIDTVSDGAWDGIYSVASRFAIDNKITSSTVGDYLTGEKGRTLYLGASSSVSQVRIYEKGKKEGGDKNWVRVEIQVRPAKAAGKRLAAGYSPHQFWGSSKWALSLINEINASGSFGAAPSLGTVWQATDDQRATAALCRQYYPLLSRLRESLPPGMDLFEYLTKFNADMVDMGNSKAGFGESWQDAVLKKCL